jgi:hypothetical protein
MGAHLIDGQFQSDKYDWCKPSFVPLKLTDTSCHDLLWEYAQRRRAVDAEFADDIETALRTAGYAPPPTLCDACRSIPVTVVVGCSAVAVPCACDRCGAATTRLVRVQNGTPDAQR